MLSGVVQVTLNKQLFQNGVIMRIASLFIPCCGNWRTVNKLFYMAALTEPNGFTVNPEYPGWASLGETAAVQLREVLSTGACTIIMAKGQNVIQESLMLLPVLNNIHCALFVKVFKYACCQYGKCCKNEPILNALVLLLRRAR